MSIATLFDAFVKAHIVNYMPPKLDDESTYGRTVDAIARHTGHHPAHIEKRLKNLVATKMLSAEDLQNIEQTADLYCKKDGINSKIGYQNRQPAGRAVTF